MDIVLLLLGIGLAVYGAHFLVDGGSAVNSSSTGPVESQRALACQSG
jgi:hypothetical protein